MARGRARYDESLTMRITFKLYAMLADHLPQEVDGHRRDGNRIELDLPDETTIQDLVERFRLPAQLVHLVLVDGHFIHRDLRATRTLKDGETLAIWPPVAGG